ncbi:pickpocket protein 28 isoform X2 [Eurytemora carolleeae]|nr:pickpocket protein 28 isoform X2 [Eurytemora carolleeae]|eukprot:XP_023328627.1 pickpocket protein 28-like isoform X2 [Eurytemora affinis]
MKSWFSQKTGPKSPVFLHNNGKFKRPKMEEFKEFCAESSIHGLKYMTEDGVSWIQRVLWIIWFILATAFLIFLFKPIIDKYSNTPTITTVDTTNYPIANIDFPGVTVCSNIRVSANNYKKASKKDPWKKYDDETKHQMVTNLVKFNSDRKVLFKMPSAEEMIVKEEKLVTNFMYQIAPSCERMFLFCKWQGKQEECKHFVTMRKTDDGFCCSFNAINLADSFAKDENSTGDDFANPYAYCDANTGSGSGNSYDSGYESNPAEEPDGSGDGADTGDGAESGSGSGSNFYCQGMSSSGSETPDSNTGDENGDLSFSGLLAGYDKDNTNVCQVPTKPQAYRKKRNTEGETPPEETETLGEGLNLEANSDTLEVLQESEEETVGGYTILRTNMAAQDLGFSFLIDANAMDEFKNSWNELTSNNFYIGFKVLVHSPHEFPDVTKKGMAIPLGSENFIGVSAQITESSDSVKAMSPSRRNCLLPDETQVPEMNVSLGAFKEYNKANCLLECTAAAMLQLCGCIPYYYPAFPKSFIDKNIKLTTYTNSTGFCHYDNLVCLSMHRGYFNAYATPGTEESYGINLGLNCNCPDDCNQIVYTKEMSNGVLKDNNDALYKNSLCEGGWTEDASSICEKTLFKQEFDQLTKYAAKIQDYNCHEGTFKKKIENTAYVHVFFRDIGVTKFNKDQLFGWQDIVAQFGGTVGLCVGFSLLSGCEIIYFLFCRRWLRK